MSYPYQGRDLFAQPETYFFADCAAADYLAGWRASREAALAVLERQGHLATPQHAQPPLPDATPIAALVAAGQIDGLMVKYEVHKRLFTHYGPDGRRHPQAHPAQPQDYLPLADMLAAQALSGSLRHLSTLLKLCDALSSAAERLRGEEAIRLAAVLRAERQAVDRLMEADPCG